MAKGLISIIVASACVCRSVGWLVSWENILRVKFGRSFNLNLALGWMKVTMILVIQERFWKNLHLEEVFCNKIKLQIDA